MYGCVDVWMYGRMKEFSCSKPRPLNSGRLEQVQCWDWGAPERDLRRCDLPPRDQRNLLKRQYSIGKIESGKRLPSVDVDVDVERGPALLESSARRGQQRWDAKTCATMNHESAVQPEDRSGGAG
jgi:hypothetical protein